MDRDAYLLLFGFVLGMVGNYVANWYVQYRRDRLIRRAMREGLTAEVIHNLEVTDNNERVLRKALNEGELVWPDAPYSIHVLSACMAPEVLGILTEGEQGKIPLLIQQLAELRDEFASVRSQLPTMGPDFRANRLWKLLDREIPYPAANLMDLLCQLLEHQDRFSSERSIYMASKVLPTTMQWGQRAPRIWRSSDLSRVPLCRRQSEGKLLAWKNDAPNLVPEGVEVIVVGMDRTPFGTVERKERGWIERLVGPIRQRRRNQAVQRDLASIQRSVPDTPEEMSK